MPPRGRRKPLSTSLSPARRELAQAVRILLHDTGGSLRSVGFQIHRSRSALDRLASGQVQNPDTQMVLALRQLAERKNPAGTVTEEELRRLLQRVLDEGIFTAAGPAADIVAHADGGTSAATAARTGALSVAPVPAADGNRRNGSTAEALWPVDELVLHLDHGRYEHAVGMLNYAGGKAPAVEAAAAIQACRARGLTEATDTLLRAVGSRSEGIVLAVVSHLIEFGNIPDAGALSRMRCSVQDA
ncbi:hypothetical protein [Nonomuraea sp. NPDC049607]|uniref:hypothetical protein n=1 Tax=Nonomuraea sp. NPDC049607 TaxID=3154732 RepID=UPI003416BB84